jgi:hypothetical protein
MLLGCGGPKLGEAPEGDWTTVRADLVTSIEAEVRGDSVYFGLHVTNPGIEPLTLEFNTAARYDFEVRTPDGAEVWRWSSDQMSAQVLGSEPIAPGETLRYRASWAPAGGSGSFVVIGRVLATNRQIEQRADFEIPKR